MKYIIYTVSLNDNKFTYRIETEAELEKSDLTVKPSNNFFQTEELAISDAKKQLIKMGIKDENIVLHP